MHARRILAGIIIQLVVSCTALAGIRVYQRSYNTTHREQIRMAGLTVGASQAELEVLGSRYAVPLGLLQEDGIWYAAYVLTDSAAHGWISVALLFIKET